MLFRVEVAADMGWKHPTAMQSWIEAESADQAIEKFKADPSVATHQINDVFMITAIGGGGLKQKRVDERATSVIPSSKGETHGKTS